MRVVEKIRENPKSGSSAPVWIVWSPGRIVNSHSARGMGDGRGGVIPYTRKRKKKRKHGRSDKRASDVGRRIHVLVYNDGDNNESQKIIRTARGESIFVSVIP